MHKGVHGNLGEPVVSTRKMTDRTEHPYPQWLRAQTVELSPFVALRKGQQRTEVVLKARETEAGKKDPGSLSHLIVPLEERRIWSRRAAQ
jgi:hypothetical protein